MLKNPIHQLRTRIRTNPLGPVLERYIEHLVDRGYSSSTLREYVSAADHFGRWLGRRPPNQAMARHFLQRHLLVCRCRGPVILSMRRCRRALNHLLVMIGAVTARSEFPRGFVGDLLRRFKQRLLTVQGLATGTVHRRLTWARTMLTRLRVRRAAQLTTWTPERIERYVTSEARRYQPSTAHNIADATRSLLRFLLQDGLIRRDLSAAVPTVAHWRLAPLPATLREDEVARLINAADDQTAIGLRDRAILLCLSEVGLRASEVVGLELEGVDVAANVLQVRRSKRRESTALPITRKLARALKAYLRRGRPPCTSLKVFVLHRPPVGKPLVPATISGIVSRLASRAGLEGRIRSAHVLRHSVASRMLTAGASLKQIADLLGHRSIDTTTIYAKVDLNALSQVALPWPGVKEVQR
ncbi:MAG TPA: site-specific integrase [Pirellulaceae bacterium]|nr:site-specific integrase [Pirellulaceae bacterium]